MHWEDHPAHFWLVLAAAVLSVVAGRRDRRRRAARRGDARLLLVSLAFVAAAGFLGLHALATPGVLLDHPNAGFVVATVGRPPARVGAAGRLGVARAGGRARRRGRGQRRLLRAALASLLAVWAVASLAEVGPLDHAHPPESGAAVLVVPALVGVALYARRPSATARCAGGARSAADRGRRGLRRCWPRR